MRIPAEKVNTGLRSFQNWIRVQTGVALHYVPSHITYPKVSGSSWVSRRFNVIYCIPIAALRARHKLSSLKLHKCFISWLGRPGIWKSTTRLESRPAFLLGDLKKELPNFWMSPAFPGLLLSSASWDEHPRTHKHMHTPVHTCNRCSYACMHVHTVYLDVWMCGSWFTAVWGLEA